MSGRHMNQPNVHSCYSHSKNASLPPRASGWHQCPHLNKGLWTHAPSATDFSTRNCHMEQSFVPTSTRLPPGRIFTGKPYTSKCVETSHVTKGPKVVSRPHCLLCTDRRPSCPSSPTFLDQLIRGINYLDRSSKSFYNNYPKTQTLPQLAATYLQRAADSFYLDHIDQPPLGSYSTPSASMVTPDHILNNTSLVPSNQEANTLQCLDNSTGMSCQHPPHSQSSTSEMPQKSGLKLPELPLFGNGLSSIDQLPKFWEAMHSGWSAPEPISKPSSWW
uniref:uncharacterized protein LOC101604551 n=1 Tax=Jaculus jaculus TaxID=51337 RepID=UPI000332F588|nr:uncharacterized protein LOC101604551 [Jaculus jaculus]